MFRVVPPMRAIAVAFCLGFACGPLAAQESAEPQAAEPQAAAETESPLAKLAWVVGPTEVKVGKQATLAVPDGFIYLHPKDTSKFQEIVQNPSNGRESLIAPNDLHWFGLLEFEDTGYVKDDEKIDADAVLDSVREGMKQANEERKSHGWAPLQITGWHFKPRYDKETQRLEWAIAAVSEGEKIVNVNTRLLGRKGVTSATLVSDPETLETAYTEFKNVLEGYQYVQGERYADVQEGDHMAEYGLAALIAGGGAAVAAKSGLLKGLWKFIVVGVAGLAAWARKLFGKKQQDA